MSKPSKRDVEKQCTADAFLAKLRRLANAIERGEPFAIQVAGERLHVPADAVLSIEHERSKGVNELEFQVRW